MIIIAFYKLQRINFLTKFFTLPIINFTKYVA
jgi:hypothetical protein